MRQRMLQALDRRPASVRPGGDEDLRSADDLITDGDAVRIKKATRPDHEMRPFPGQFGRLRIPAAVENALRPVDRSRPVHANVAGDDPELVQSFGELIEFCDPDQGLLGDSTIVQSSAAESISFDDSHRLLEAQGDCGRRAASGAPAKHDEIEDSFSGH